MKRSIAKYLIGGVSAALSLTLVVGLCISALGLERVAPENTISGKTSPILIEAVSARLNVTDKDKLGDETNGGDDSGKSDETKPDAKQEPPDSGNAPETDAAITDEKNKVDAGADEDPGSGGVPNGDTRSGGGDQHDGGGNVGNDGDDKGDGNNHNKPDPDKTGPRIVTDLATKIVTDDDACVSRGGGYSFYAYIANGEKDMFLNIYHEYGFFYNDTDKFKKQLTADGQDYKTTLPVGKSRFTIYLRQGINVLQTVEFWVTYTPAKADVNHPERGDHPPSVVTNMDGWPAGKEVKNHNFTFLVKARTYKNEVIYRENIVVKLNGVTFTDTPTGDGAGGYEYRLRLEPTQWFGNYSDQSVTVLAWDDEGNSVFRKFDFILLEVSDLEPIGYATIFLDTTTVGCSEPPYATYPLGEPMKILIRQGQPASYQVCEFLEENGIEYERRAYSYSGTKDNGFYIKKISLPLWTWQTPPAGLWEKILQDGLTVTEVPRWADLGEYDYTSGSGWMYSVNGRYPGKSMSEYFLSDGDVLALRYTLAYGKDIGGYTATGGGRGLLDTYCGTWMDGVYTDMHVYDGGVWREPTCTETGYTLYTCTARGCGHTKTEPSGQPAGHQWRETGRVAPTETTDGYVDYICSVCGDTRRDALPATGGGTDPGTPDVPDDSGEIVPPDDSGGVDGLAESGGRGIFALLARAAKFVVKTYG